MIKFILFACIIFFNACSTLAYADNHPATIEDLNRAIAINPNSADAYYDRAILWEKQGDWPQAIADFSQTIKLNPQDTQAISNRGNAYAQQNNFTQAIADFNRVIELNPQDADAYYNRGLALDALGPFQTSYQ